MSRALLSRLGSPLVYRSISIFSNYVTTTPKWATQMEDTGRASVYFHSHSPPDKPGILVRPHLPVHNTWGYGDGVLTCFWLVFIQFSSGVCCRGSGVAFRLRFSVCTGQNAGFQRFQSSVFCVVSRYVVGDLESSPSMRIHSRTPQAASFRLNFG